MKKMILVGLVGLVAAIGLAQTPNVLNAQAVAVRGKDWRVGASFPVSFAPNTLKTVGLNAWALTDGARFDRTYLGAGLNLPLLHSKNASFGLTGGWSGDFSELRHVKAGQWGVGAQFTLRF